MTADDRAGAEPAVPAPARTIKPGRPVGPVSLATEKDYQRTIVDTVKMFGWRVHHSRPAWTSKGWKTPIQGHRGFPDLVLAHPVAGVLFVELKYSTKLTEDQARWGQVLTQAGANWQELRVPDGLQAFCQLLADAPRGAA